MHGQKNIKFLSWVAERLTYTSPCPWTWTCKKLFMFACFLRHRISSFSSHWNDRSVRKCWELLLPSVVMNVSQLITLSSPLHCPTLGRVCEYHLTTNTTPRLWYLQTVALYGSVLERQFIRQLSDFSTLVKCLSVMHLDHQSRHGVFGLNNRYRYAADPGGHSCGDYICLAYSLFILSTLIVVQIAYVYG